MLNIQTINYENHFQGKYKYILIDLIQLYNITIFIWIWIWIRMSIDKNVDKPVIIIFPCHLINTDIPINQLMWSISKFKKDEKLDLQDSNYFNYRLRLL